MEALVGARNPGLAQPAVLAGLGQEGEVGLAERLGAAVYVAEPGAEGRWLYVSPVIQDICGLTPDDLQDDPGLWSRRLHPLDRAQVLERESNLQERGRVRSEYRLTRPDGRVVWVLDDAVVAPGCEGNQVLHGFIFDITDRKRTELKLAAHADIVEAVANGTDLVDTLTALARAVEGLGAGGSCLVEVSGTEAGVQPLVVSSAGLRQEDRSAPGLAAPILSASGGTLGRVVLLDGPDANRAIEDPELPAWAARLAALAVVRAREHERTATSVALLRATLESTVDGILVVDSNGRIAGYNQTFAQMWHIDPELLASGDDAAVMASVLDQLIDPDQFVAQVARLYDQPEETSFDELAFVDGRIFERYSQPQRVDGSPRGRVWSFRDVTEKRRLRQGLADSEESLRLLVGQVRDYAILQLDPAGHVLTWNAGAERIKGYTGAEILGEHFSVFYTPEDVAAGLPEQLLKRALAEGQCTNEGWRVRKDGSRFRANVTITALHDDQGELRGFGKVTRDITARHQAEVALGRTARILQLLGSVAAAANSAPEVEEALTAALEAFCEFGGWQLAHAYLADHADPSVLRHSVWHETTPGSFEGFKRATHAVDPSEITLVHAVLPACEPLWLPDLATDPSFGRVAAAAQDGLVSGCAFPILVKEKPVGVLEFFSTEPQQATTDLVPVMRQLGTQLGRVVERERAEHHLAERAAQLTALSDRLETVLNSAGEGIYGLDARGIVTFVNETGAALVGLPRERIVGRHADDVLPAEPHPSPIGEGSGVRADAEAPTSVPVTGRYRRGDGTHFDAEWIAAPVVRAGAETDSVVVFRDVSERRAVDRLKDEFISVVSHELRTPLTAIRGALGLLGGGAAGQLSPSAARMVEVATTSAERLIRLVTNILDIERMGAGQLPLQPRCTAAGDVVATAVRELEPLATQRGVRLVVAATPGQVMADPDRVVQVLTNLMGNAVKFSDPGSEVHISTTQEDAQICFTVQDHGVGIPPDQLELIFEPFRQADSSDTRHYAGTGLGLAICRGLVEQQGGRIWASSGPTGGARFSFTLPRAQADNTNDQA